MIGISICRRVQHVWREILEGGDDSLAETTMISAYLVMNSIRDLYGVVHFSSKLTSSGNAREQIE